jgi:chemotaxis protein CheD
MAEHVIGIGEMAASARPTDSLLTLALGSCVAVVAHDPGSGATGLAHIALPGGAGDGPRSQGVGYYADTAIPALLELMAKHGAPAHGGGLQIKLIGGASMLESIGGFSIGRRNVVAVKRLLDDRRLTPLAEDTGGSRSRTVRVQVGGCRPVVTSPGHPPTAL